MKKIFKKSYKVFEERAVAEEFATQFSGAQIIEKKSTGFFYNGEKISELKAAILKFENVEVKEILVRKVEYLRPVHTLEVDGFYYERNGKGKYEEVNDIGEKTGKLFDAEEVLKMKFEIDGKDDDFVIMEVEEEGKKTDNDDNDDNNDNEEYLKFFDIVEKKKIEIENKIETVEKEIEKLKEEIENLIYVDRRFVKNGGQLLLLDKSKEEKDYGYCGIAVKKVIKDKNGNDVFIFDIVEENVDKSGKVNKLDELEKRKDDLGWDLQVLGRILMMEIKEIKRYGNVNKLKESMNKVLKTLKF